MTETKPKWSPYPVFSHSLGLLSAAIASIDLKYFNFGAFIGGFVANGLLSWLLPVIIADIGRKKSTATRYNWKLLIVVVIGSAIVLLVHFTA